MLLTQTPAPLRVQINTGPCSACLLIMAEIRSNYVYHFVSCGLTAREQFVQRQSAEIVSISTEAHVDFKMMLLHNTRLLTVDFH